MRSDRDRGESGLSIVAAHSLGDDGQLASAFAFAIDSVAFRDRTFHGWEVVGLSAEIGSMTRGVRFRICRVVVSRGPDCYSLTPVTMGLDLIPSFDPCVEGAQLNRCGVARKSITCPFRGLSAYPGSCSACWCRGKVAACALEAMGMARLASALYRDQSAEEAVLLGKRLERAARTLGRKLGSGRATLERAAWSRTYGAKAKGQDHWRIEDAVQAIEDCAHWLKVVGQLGSGVVAWS